MDTWTFPDSSRRTLSALVTIARGKDGLLQVSQISSQRVENVSDKLNKGDMVKVEVLEVDKQCRIRLSWN
jgi:polyribonucleotide nucleotidyltransferase